MSKLTREDALNYHSEGRPGKIEVIPTKSHSSQRDLSLAYSPGVADPCLAIKDNPEDAYKYTAKGNLVAVMSNGTAVLGLGDIGAVQGKPVMEGKGLLFKIFADIDVFDIEIDQKEVDGFIEVARSIGPMKIPSSPLVAIISSRLSMASPVSTATITRISWLASFR